MTKENCNLRLSDADLSSRSRVILYHSALPTDPVVAREQASILGEWVRRRSGLNLTPPERVELGVARWLIDDLGAGTDGPPYQGVPDRPPQLAAKSADLPVIQEQRRVDAPE